jgi:membrane protease YdiL (CAAX protease family)
MIDGLALDALTWSLIVSLGVIAPLWGTRGRRKFEQALAAGDPEVRMREYAHTIRIEWISALVLATAWLGLGRPLEALRLAADPNGWEWGVVLLGLGLMVYMIISSVRTERDPEQLAKLRDTVGSLAFMAAQTSAERRRFIWLSITAGICEEIVYRGVLLAALSTHVGLWPAVGLSSLIFGLGHAYQGVSGILRTGAVGLVMALLAVGTGTLWVPIVLHAVIDVFQGRVLSAIVSSKEDTPAAVAA